ncbi:MAG: Uma2 family endonuclease [Bacillota bacterium]|jgi:Uma2 family endonuclease
MSLPQENKKHTYADYLTWPENERWEIIDGTAYLQAAPTWQHQSISGELFRQISNYLVAKPCKVFAAPFDLCLTEEDPADDEIINVLPPDIVVVCESANGRKHILKKIKLRPTVFPDLVVNLRLVFDSI